LKTFKLTLFASSVVLLAACASKPEPAKTVPQPTNVTLDELNTAIEGGVKIQNEKGEAVVCRREAKTGSRLARETICLTQAEWTRVSEQSQRETKKTMRMGKIPQGN
jgi:uncharacterized lipoprotein